MWRLAPHFAYFEHAYCADEVGGAEVEALEGLFTDLCEFSHGQVGDFEGGGGGVVFVEVKHFKRAVGFNFLIEGGSGVGGGDVESDVVGVEFFDETDGFPYAFFGFTGET